jgi:alpha-galactosidase
MVAEQLPDGRRHVQFGHAHGSQLQPVLRYESAPLYLAYSNQGMNGCGVQFQRQVRRAIVRSTQAGSVRPVHYNCWEAVYFKHNVDELIAIATRAAELGAERFVLDDGWFGTRDDDTQSLGDWWVDARKYPDGLMPLVAAVKQLGMQFGIWFEPEMINENSDTYRQHPDWVLGPQDQILGRQQNVLDLSQAAVCDYLFERISDLLSAYPIDYIKWDHNRVLPHYDNDQVTGVYQLIDRLQASFPEVEIESCASGGGRIDFGMLERTQRVWLSDSNDAIERSRIQAGAARFLPASVTGSHVGPRHCHTSGRHLSIQFRSWVAAQRHMGFEMDPRELTSEEAEVLRRVTAWWKQERAFLMQADIYRLDNPDPSVICEQHMSASQDRFIVFANKVDTSSQILPATIRLAQLIPERNYTITLVNRDELHHLSRGTPLLKQQSLTASGRYLMNKGIELPWSFPCQTWTLVGEMAHD